MPGPFVPRFNPGSMSRVPRFEIRLIGMLLLTACTGSTDPASNRVAIEASDFIVPIAGTLQLELFATNASGVRLPISAVKWSSDNAAVAPVGATGVVEGRSFGSATITASRGGSSDAVVVTVKPAAIEFSMSGERILATGETTTLMARAVDALGRTISGSDSELRWTWGNEDVVEVRMEHGTGAAVVTGVRLGLTTLTASAFGLSQSVGFVVLPAGSDASASVRVDEFRLLETPGNRLLPQVFTPVLRVRNQGELLQLTRVDVVMAGMVDTFPPRCTSTDFWPGTTWDLFANDHFEDPFTYSGGPTRVRTTDALALLTFRTSTGALRGVAAIGPVESGTPPYTSWSPAYRDC